MTVDFRNMFRYPYSKVLGNLPCGKDPTPQAWLNVGAKANFPPYKGAPHENCGHDGGCTPRLRFIDGDNDLAMSRKELRQSNNRAWMNNKMIEQNSEKAIFSPMTNFMHMSNIPRQVGSLTPFRTLMNAGDPANTYNMPIAGRAQPGSGAAPNAFANFDPLYTNVINQVSSTRRSSNGSAVSNSGITPITNNSEGALWSGNNKWVYDGADYVRFKKLQAKNRNFNDVSWGGDRHNATQTVLSRVRR